MPIPKGNNHLNLLFTKPIIIEISAENTIIISAGSKVFGTKLGKTKNTNICKQNSVKTIYEKRVVFFISF